MKVLIAPNSFKGCLSAAKVGTAIADGIKSVLPEAKITMIPLSDGGDGLLDVCAFCLGGEYIYEDTFDALMRPMKAPWLKTGKMAVIELAQASGLAKLMGPREYNPMIASTFGTGRLIACAMEDGCSQVVIGLGGSATVDAGCGIAAALGFGLLDAKSRPIPPGGGNLGLLEKIVIGNRRKPISKVQCACLTDVRCPLLGPSGAARLFGPQKGATAAQVVILEKNLEHWARIVERDLGVKVGQVEGAGAAGGAGAGCAAFLGARPQSGAEWVGRQAGLEKAAADADIIFTGEGRIDSQTGFGKIPAYVGRIAQKRQKRVVALGGAVEKGIDLGLSGLTECRCVTPAGCSPEAAFRDAEKNLAFEAAKVMMRFT